MPDRQGWGEGTAQPDEDALIAQLAGLVGDVSPEIIRGIGDDAAVLAPDLIWTVDTQVEGVHFRRDLSTPYDVGWKALAVNLSDLAAMGARPIAALVSVILPAGGSVDLEPIYAGLGACSVQYNCPVVGGDITRGSGLALSISVLGRAAVAPPGRAGARRGDVIAVTGTLGESAAGFAVLTDSGLADMPGATRCRERHLRPCPRLADGALLATNAHAMMDISDGLATDLRRLARRSNVRIQLNLDALPMRDDVRAIGAAMGVVPGVLAATGGEDYELVVALSERRVESCGVALTVVGRVVDGAVGIAFSGVGADEGLRGWDHLR